MENNAGSLWQAMTRLFRPRTVIGRAADSPAVLDEYVDAMPSAQNAVDLVGGWNHALPPEAGVVAGEAALYADDRINWCLEQFGSITGRRILELGPLEGVHTYMLNREEPSLIHAIEANKASFMRCLIAKNLLGLNKAHFMLGDFLKWLEFSLERYDLIIASGVLYHMADPVRLLELMSARSDALYLWTHYFAEMPRPTVDGWQGAFSGEVETDMFMGLPIRLHKRSYHEAWRDKAFCGGMHDGHSWMEKDQILSVLNRLGYLDVRITHDATDNPRGPSVSIFAHRLKN